MIWPGTSWFGVLWFGRSWGALVEVGSVGLHSAWMLGGSGPVVDREWVDSVELHSVVRLGGSGPVGVMPNVLVRRGAGRGS